MTSPDTTSQTTRAVISAIGHDRPGLVSDLTSIADDLILNIEDSRMTVLGGEFAVLMSIAGDEGAIQTCEQRLENLANEKGLAVIFRRTGGRTIAGETRAYKASVVALDHPGIVHAIAQFFSSRSINIRDLTTETSPAAHTGTPIFNVTLIAEIPGSQRVHELKQAFDEFCETQDLDGELTAER